MRLHDRGPAVAILTTPEATTEDCALASVVIVTVPLRSPCDGPEVVIDLKDIKKLGAHAVWVNREDVRMETVSGATGRRPWTQFEPPESSSVVDSH